MFSNGQYLRYRKLLQGLRLPLAFVDLEAFDRNTAYVSRLAQGTGRTIRLGTKSIRCEPLLRRIFDSGGPAFRGLLTYTVEETAGLPRPEPGRPDHLPARQGRRTVREIQPALAGGSGGDCRNRSHLPG
jgi:hypothetical protein